MNLNTALNSDTTASAAAIPDTQGYEAPAIETVIALDELEREVHYAGFPGSLNPR